MKTSLKLLACAVVCFVVTSYGDTPTPTPTATTTPTVTPTTTPTVTPTTTPIIDRVKNNSYAVTGVLVGSDTMAFDTIISTSSDTLFNKFMPLQANDCVLTWDAMTGTGSDSIQLFVDIRCFDRDNRYLYTVRDDTISTVAGAAGGNVLLHINSTAIGQRYSVCLTGGSANGGEVIINRFKILYRRPLQRNQ